MMSLDAVLSFKKGYLQKFALFAYEMHHIRECVC